MLSRLDVTPYSVFITLSPQMWSWAGPRTELIGRGNGEEEEVETKFTHDARVAQVTQTGATLP